MESRYPRDERVNPRRAPAMVASTLRESIATIIPGFVGDNPPMSELRIERDDEQAHSWRIAEETDPRA